MGGGLIQSPPSLPGWDSEFWSEENPQFSLRPQACKNFAEHDTRVPGSNPDLHTAPRSLFLLACLSSPTHGVARGTPWEEGPVFWKTPSSASSETCLRRSGLRSGLSFKGHLLPFTCRKQGLFSRRSASVYTTLKVFRVELAAEGVGWEAY